MNLRTTLFAGSIPVLLVIASTTSAFQEKPKPGGAHDAHGKKDDPAAGWEMPKAGKEHAKMKERAGTWDATVVMMGAPPTKGTEKVTMLGEFHHVSEFQGEMMGQPFTGHGTTSYHPETQEYVSTWIDTTSPHLMVMRGKMDASGKTITQKGDGAGMDGKPVMHKSTLELTGPDSHVFKMWMGDMPEPMLVIEYKRRK